MVKVKQVLVWRTHHWRHAHRRHAHRVHGPLCSAPLQHIYIYKHVIKADLDAIPVLFRGVWHGPLPCIGAPLGHSRPFWRPSSVIGRYTGFPVFLIASVHLSWGCFWDPWETGGLGGLGGSFLGLFFCVEIRGWGWTLHCCYIISHSAEVFLAEA